ncbi:MAG: 2-amino-4-hydroxy-6-hydroxymethyldihydropteridine diphosphokinase [Eubacterium sp.]|nr:2-amino-4-hydroxy-6-hydroxymethyldihydropteridine diphosphokinase [Eubacterium sp.]
MDEIRIKDLEIYGHHGVLKEENVLGQKFLVSMSLGLSLHSAGISDDISESIDYAAVSHLVKEEMEKTTYKLIEALAEHLCEAILIRFPVVERITMELKKPWAPILLPLDTVSVCMTRNWHDVYLSVGSNLGDKKKYIDDSIDELRKDKKIRIERQSVLVETLAYGVTDQPPFLNGALFLKTLYEPEELLVKLHEIEALGGRERTEHWGPRTIDLDILYYDDLVYTSDTLVIPHPDMENRAFVLGPLTGIAPYKRHPVTGMTTGQMYEKLKSVDSPKWL